MSIKRHLAVSLAVVMMLAGALSTCAYAESIIQPYASTLIKSTSITIIAQTGGTVQATANIQCTSAVEKLGFAYVKIQENRNGTWTTVKTVYDQFAANATRFSYTISYNGSPGMQYRAQASFYAQNGIDSDSRSGTSSIITAKN